MEIPTEFILYHTAGCHLCDEARVLIAQIPHLVVKEVEIGDDSRLIDCYGTKIPVLFNTKTQAVLNWPFTLQDMMQAIQIDKS
ncbi:glutaredoxin family protein [Candidatus Nitrosacidococcus tergens]|uniref:Glutaredoxin 2 n=1 Tax=Candidatus Nitrosacidococcus tergens TaxID=553981 RepID=A0A7G1Q805_9GAMM|nr:glutaredoxin family protein [Candidatus Nitrosacidococcus tergens]CAB1274405.1 Glutaredoxin 2 [Candidatus Nitrosacidococcus tergens]